MPALAQHIIAEIGFAVALAGSTALLVSMLRQDYAAIMAALSYRADQEAE